MRGAIPLLPLTASYHGTKLSPGQQYCFHRYCGLWLARSGVVFPALGRDLSLPRNVQTGSDPLLASYSIDNGCCFPGVRRWDRQPTDHSSSSDTEGSRACTLVSGAEVRRVRTFVTSSPCEWYAGCSTVPVDHFTVFLYTGCPRRNGQNFGRVFLVLKYIDITQNTYIQSWTVTEIMAREVWKYDSCYTLTDYQIRIKTGRNMWFL